MKNYTFEIINYVYPDNYKTGPDFNNLSGNIERNPLEIYNSLEEAIKNAVNLYGYKNDLKKIDCISEVEDKMDEFLLGLKCYSSLVKETDNKFRPPTEEERKDWRQDKITLYTIIVAARFYSLTKINNDEGLTILTKLKNGIN